MKKTLKSIDIYYEVTPKYNIWIKITDPRFQRYKKELYGTAATIIPQENPPVNKYPKIWLSTETAPELLQILPESKPINDSGGNHIPYKYPSYYVLNYPINNFKIYVTNKDFFMSKLPLLPDITTSYRKGTWDDYEIYYKILFSF